MSCDILLRQFKINQTPKTSVRRFCQRLVVFHRNNILGMSQFLLCFQPLLQFLRERGTSRRPAAVFKKSFTVVSCSVITALCRMWIVLVLKSTSSHCNPPISPRCIPVSSAMSKKVRARGFWARFNSSLQSTAVSGSFSTVFFLVSLSVVLTGDFATNPFSCAILKILFKLLRTLIAKSYFYPKVLP